jgi:hypothetical protein
MILKICLPETFLAMRIIIIVLLLFCITAAAQEPAATLGYDYSSIYNSTSAGLTRHNADFSLNSKPVKVSAGVSVYSIDYNQENAPYYSSAIQNITAIYTSATYNHTLNDNWAATVTFTPKVVSDLKKTGIKDVYPGFFAGFTYKPSEGKSTSLTFGAGYNGYFGKYRFMPVVNFSGNINDKASFNIGIPATWVSYKLSAAHSLKALVATDGFYSRFTVDETNSIYNTTATTHNLEMVNINSGLEYGYHSGTEWMALIRAGYSLYNKLSMPYSGGVSDIGFKNNLYISAGFKYNLNFK